MHYAARLPPNGRLTKPPAASRLPKAITTSFTLHEQPIINRPEEALRKERMDALVAPAAIWGTPPG